MEVDQQADISMAPEVTPAEIDDEEKEVESLLSPVKVDPDLPTVGSKGKPQLSQLSTLLTIVTVEKRERDEQQAEEERTRKRTKTEDPDA